MTERTAAQLNNSLDSVWKLVWELKERVSALEFAQPVATTVATTLTDWSMKRPDAVSPDGVVHNFQANVGAASVALNSVVDSRGLYVQIDGRGTHFLIIPWVAIDKKRLEALNANTKAQTGTQSTPWWKP